eukprot:m.461607 g.461607  ORF g.461607 m.461607 type:complete len:248 (-) comp22361_c0_seq1:88-831(-)
MFGLALSAVRGVYSLVTTREDDCNLGSSEDGITLIYFDGRGRAEAIRFVLGLAGAQFTERFVRTRADFLQVLEEGHAPFGQLPVLLDGPLTLSNSMACARHVARRFGLYGSGDLREMARIDMLADSALDFYNAGMLAFPFSGDSGKVADSCAKYWPKFEAVLGPQIARGDVCLVGNSPSYADAILLMNALCSLEHDANSLDNYPAVQAWLGATRAIPTMAAFVASDQRHPPADAKYVREVQVSLGRV